LDIYDIDTKIPAIIIIIINKFNRRLTYGGVKLEALKNLDARKNSDRKLSLESFMPFCAFHGKEW
jgi:hypothetical protein